MDWTVHDALPPKHTQQKHWTTQGMADTCVNNMEDTAPPADTPPCTNAPDCSRKSLKPASLSSALQRSISALFAAFSSSDTPPAAATAAATDCVPLLLLLLPRLAAAARGAGALPDFAAAGACRLDAGTVAASEGKSEIAEMLGAALLLLLPDV
jgi:hypothetical protein